MLRSVHGLVVVAGVTAGCASSSDPPADPASTSSPLASGINSYCPYDAGATTSAGDGWVNDFVWQQLGYNAQVQYAVTPSEPSQQPIDAVIGMSNGPATTFTEMGPIVRFNPSGYIDVRDGSSYRADTSLPYTDGTQYVIHLYLNFSTHTYTVTVGHYDDPNIVTVAQNYAFRTEQADMARADTLAREIDSSTGSVTICGYAASGQYHYSSAGSGWNSTPFRSESGLFRVDVEAVAQTSNVDAVVGLAATTPRAFADLAAIARFSPTGVIDVRDGSTYRADTEFVYSVNEGYHFIFDVDVAAGTYSVSVRDGNVTTTIATDYAFRTEQQGVSSLGTLGQYVDGNSGAAYTAFLLESY